MTDSPDARPEAPAAAPRIGPQRIDQYYPLSMVRADLAKRWTLEETDYRMGKVTDEIRLATASDGKTIDVTDKDVQHGQTTTYKLDKQP